MTGILLSPHNDDEGLFAAYTLLRHRPRVLVVLDGGRSKRYHPPPEVRAAESAAAMEILGCDFEHLGFPLERATLNWDAVEERLRAEPDPAHVWAPFPEHDGHRHHNRLAEAAIRIWPGRVSFYTTYHVREDGWPIRTVIGDPVPVEPGWPELKRQALGCYRSQIESPGTAMHFDRPLDEYEVPTLRLNLGGFYNPIPGFVNLDRQYGWMFESGLADYPAQSVEAITISHVLMYVGLEHWPFIFSELHRVLIPGGTIRITEDSTSDPASGRQGLRKRAAVATTPELALDHLAAAGIHARPVGPDETGFSDRSLIQQNYGQPPDVFHVEGTTKEA